MSTEVSSESLSGFFSRPLKIDTFEWSTSAALSRFINPWARYFTNPRVINRIANYNLLQATLCIKVLINGNPFYFGRAMMYYNPLISFDEFRADSTGLPDTFKNVLNSQRPKIFIDPTESQGGCMELPFYYPYNALSIPDAEWDRMGQIRFSELSALKHANGATDPIQITVYAWCKDIHLSVPTSDQPVLTAQSGTADEYGEGIVSAPAAAIAATAGMMTSVPVIGPYARATEMAAKGVGAAAKVFGYSKPVDITPISGFQQAHYGQLSTTSGPDLVQKFTYDPKSEVTIDPTVTGLESLDEMSLKYLCEKESYLTSVTWGSADVANVRLAEVMVTPALFNRYSVDGALVMTSLCHATVPFQYWRGNIKFRLQIVASKFHKGRLLISWDPSYFRSEEENVQYSKIIDISEDRDITFEIGWGQARSYLPLLKPDTVIPFRLRTAAYPTYEEGTNGILSIRVLNPLAVTTDASLNNDIDINVFASAGDGFEVMDPVALLPAYSPFQDQSFEGPMEEQMDVLDATPPVTISSETMGETVIDKSSLIYHSDPVVSLRQLFKRYTHGFTVFLDYETVNPAHPGPQQSGYILPALLPPYGYNPEAVTQAINLSPFEYARLNMINWYSLCYLGYRGSIRHKFFCSSTTPEGNPVQSKIIVRRANNNFTMQSTGLTYVGTSDSNANRQGYQYTQAKNTGSGIAMSDMSLNSTLTVEVPYIQPSRFSLARDNTLYNENVALTRHPRMNAQLECSRPGIDPDNTCVKFDSLMCAGEDFSLSFHVGPPVLYLVAKPLPLE